MTVHMISARPSLEQMVAIVSFMEEHPALGLGQLRGMEGREVAKKLWFKLTRVVNNISGPTRPMKSWIKFWADKKSQVRNKVLASGGDPNLLSSNLEKKIWDLFLANHVTKTRSSVKQEVQYLEESVLNDDFNMDEDNIQQETNVSIEEPFMDIEDRQMAVMDKLVKVMGEQATALSQLAHAQRVSSEAMERLAEAAQIQARAADRLATAFETIGAATHDIRNAVVDMDVTLKRFYSTSGT